jgi:hypothetical protein
MIFVNSIAFGLYNFQALNLVAVFHRDFLKCFPKRRITNRNSSKQSNLVQGHE